MSILELLLYSIVLEDRRMLTKTKNNRSSLLKTKDVSLQHLATLNSFLDGQQSQTQYINKQIKKEVELAKKNQAIVNKTIYKINNEAQSLARRYEEEKERNEKLEFLVKHIQSQILSAKMEKANDLKQNIETDQLVELTEVLSEREKELQKICEKSNSEAYQLTKKIDTIRSLRSQRTIFSALFDKLERELCNLEHCYKVLVIENKMQNQELELRVQEFNQCQNTGNKQLQKLQTKRNDNKERKNQVQNSLRINKSQVLSVKQSQKTANNETPTVEQQRKKVPSYTKQQLNKEVREKQKSLKYDNLVEKLAREKRVKVAMNELGISSIKQLPQDIEQLRKNNEELLNENQLFFNLIQKTEEKLMNLAKKKKSKKNFQRKRGQLSKTATISNFETQIKKNKLQLGEFKQVCKILHQKINQDQGREMEDFEFLNEEEEIVFYMGELQKYMEKSYALKGINCLEKSKKPRPQTKRLTSFLVSNHNEKNNFSIYEQKDLLDIAKRDMQKLNRSQVGNMIRLKSE